MKLLLTTLLFCAYLGIKAQDTGIKFQNSLNWAQLKEKAQKENRYIFVDCYTTWCGPCKVMAKEIFPLPEVADFFNENFISVALQFDKTKKDDADTKRWYRDVESIEKKYQVNAYPTYLFFNPQGMLVHTIIGGSPDGKTFVTKAKQALDPKTQLTNLKKQYAAGDRSQEFLLFFINALGMSWDDQVTEVINVYLPTQKNLLTKENLEFIARATQKSTDPGFKIVKDHAKELDAVTGIGRSKGIITDVAFDEIVLPMIRINGAKVTRAGGMYYYTGDLNKNVNWEEVKLKLQAQYPQLANEILATSKVRYARDLNNWPKFTEAVDAFMAAYGDAQHADQINAYANDIFLFSDDKKCIEKARGWSKQILDLLPADERDGYIITYANLLIKLGKKDEALAIADEGINRLGDKADEFKDLRDRINKVEKN
ncbi:MAG: DUF255 domain-containing protein [Sphingobacteriaceae bacterium]|nr:MAG: DUF255 domain-containing protein [Sphingobacteriaceae bacterium]